MIELKRVLEVCAKKPAVASPLRHGWAQAFEPAWKLTAVLLTVIVGWRGFVLLGPPHGAGPWMVAHFLFMAVATLGVLSREGRVAIGWRSPTRPIWLLWGALLGAVAALVTGAIGYFFFGWSPDNWYVSFGQTMLQDPRLADLHLATMAIALAAPAAVFSPVAEELFFRGLLQTTIENTAGRMTAIIVTAGSFGLMHLFHHGLAYTGEGLQVLALSGLIWLWLVIGQSLLFSVCRIRGGSLWPAIASHAAFNISMVIFIVFLWPR